MKKLILTYFFALSSSIFSQNLIYNPSMEIFKNIPLLRAGYNNLNDYTDYWKELYGTPNYYNDTSTFSQFIDTFVVPRYLMPNAFKGHSYLWFYGGVKTKDTIDNYSFSLAYSSNLDIYKYPLYNSNSAFYQKMKTALIKDSIYILSYRLKSGSELKLAGFGFDSIGQYNYNQKNIVNNFGVVFSTKDISKPQRYKIPYREELQDTILDTTFKWRLIEREFVADSAYEYINFAQFRDLRTIKYKVVLPAKATSNGERLNYNYIYFPLLVDDVRLLPKWQYLKTTAEVYTCGKDSLEMEVFSGAGGYAWIEQGNPSHVLSTSSKLKVKANDTNNMYIVMSPYDTAYIPVYAMKQTFKNDTLNYTICNQNPLEISNPNIYLWNDAKTDTLRFLDKPGFYWFETKGLCQINRTIINLFEGKTYNDTITVESCNIYKFGDSSYSKSGVYTHKYIAKNGCDSFSTLILTSKEVTGKIKLENGINYTALTPNATYQWYYCYPWSRITNAQNQTFSTTTKGSYAVVVSSLGCTDTSDCVALYSSDIRSMKQNNLQIYPNPIQDHFTIQFDIENNENSVEIYNSIGQKIKSFKTKSYEIQIDMKEEAKGIYLVKVNEFILNKVLKE